MKNLSKYTSRIAILGLSIISVTAGFQFYHALFNLVTAILCCVIFEMLRLYCLWSLVIAKQLNKSIAIFVYILVAGTCSFAAITNFHTQITSYHIKSRQPLEQELDKRIAQIKKIYSEKMETELAVLTEKIDICKQKLAFDTTSVYWQNRLRQRMEEKQMIIASGNKFLEEIPNNKKIEWISKNTALLKIDYEPIEHLNTTATTIAIKELWKISEFQAKKVVSIFIVVIVEMGIVLLSLFVKSTVYPHSNSHDNDKLINLLQSEFDECEIRNFIDKTKDYLIQHKKLPPARKIAVKHRKLRKFLLDGNFRSENICTLFETYPNGE